MNVSDSAFEICCHTQTDTNRHKTIDVLAFILPVSLPERTLRYSQFKNSSINVGVKVGNRREDEKLNE